MPSTKRTVRSRSAAHVVDELETLRRRLKKSTRSLEASEGWDHDLTRSLLWVRDQSSLLDDLDRDQLRNLQAAAFSLSSASSAEIDRLRGVGSAAMEVFDATRKLERARRQ